MKGYRLIKQIENKDDLLSFDWYSLGLKKPKMILVDKEGNHANFFKKGRFIYIYLSTDRGQLISISQYVKSNVDYVEGESDDDEE